MAPIRTAADTLYLAWLRDLHTIPVLPPVPPIMEWVRAQGIVIGNENTTFRGQPYDLSRFPVVTSLLTAFFEDREANELFVEKPVQTTFTTTLIFCVGWHMVFHGGNTIIALHTRDAGRDKSKDEIAPLLRQIPALGESEDTADVESSTTVLRFTFGNVKIGSGATKATLTGDPASVVILDECELHPIIDGAHSTQRAKERLTGALHGGKLIAGSKPEMEAEIEKDERTGKWKLKRQDGTNLDAGYCAGNQLHYVCPCPHCGTFVEPELSQLRFDHCNLALPGARPDYDLDRVLKETYWLCPHCTTGRVHEGPEKEKWVRAGKWVPCPLEERRLSEIFPRPIPGRWSARMSAFTDIAFESLQWGRLAVRWLEAQNDPAALRGFINSVCGRPFRRAQSENTTLDHVRRLIAQPRGAQSGPLPTFYVPPWRWRDDDGHPTRTIPLLSSQVRHIAICLDTQDRTVKWTVRAHARDGTAPLLEYGEWPWSRDMPELGDLLATARYYPLDHATAGSCGITIGLWDPKGHHWHDVLELTIRYPLITACAGEGRKSVASKHSGPVWQITSNRRPPNPGVIPLYIHANNHWETRLYEDCIQHFDPTRYRSHAPALWMPTDVGNDFLEELTTSYKFLKNGIETWGRTGTNDWGDCTKLHLMIDWLIRLLPLQQNATRQATKPYRLTGTPASPPSSNKPGPKTQFYQVSP